MSQVIEATRELPAVSESVARVHSVSSDTPAGRALIAAGRWILLGALVYAPWAYGCTRPWSISILNFVLGLATTLWLAGCLLNRARPRISPVLGIAVVLLLVQGWWMTMNSGFSYDAEFQPHPRPNWSPRFPGAVDFAVAWPTMTGLSAMFGALLVAVGMGESRRWRKRLWLTMALTGCSVIALGLAQKLTQAPGIFWQMEGHAPTFFGPFRYHANAGSFINLVWPLTAACLALSIRRQESLGRRIFWSVSFVLCIAGALANTSRASGFITVALLGAWMAWVAFRWFRRRHAGADANSTAGVALLLAAVLFGVLAAGGLDKTLRRWANLENEINSANSRLLVARVCVEMLPQSGWLGFGPGTFPTAFPFFNKDTSNATRGVWLQAHQDYLQTLIEWGWLGAALWAVVIGGGLAVAGWGVLRRQWSSRDRVFSTAAGAAVVAVLLHSLVDFPLQIASLQLYFAVLLGVLWSSRRWISMNC